MAFITDLRFEHYNVQHTLGVQEPNPRLSWKFRDAPSDFKQSAYEITVLEDNLDVQTPLFSPVRVESNSSTLVPWPSDKPLQSRQEIQVQLRVWDE